MHVRTAERGDIPRLTGFRRAEDGDAFPQEYWDQALAEQESGKREVFLGLIDENLIGYVHYNKFPQYAPFRRLGIPEIQDLRIGKSYRGSGYGRQLIEYCENQARQNGADTMGIAVGLLPSYGAAQRLYIKMGYVPDGNGVAHDRETVRFGELKAIDDNLCLMMIKALI